MFVPDRELSDHAVELCQQLLQIDTSNPPGEERQAAELCADELASAGLEPVVLDSAPGRSNVVARVRGTGELPPLLLSGHLDVVPAEAADWSHPPFAGEIADGFLWGRGAIDMKNMVAMGVALLCRLSRQGVPLRRDVIFAAVADEETGSERGSRWLCDEHPDLVRAEFAIGEVGGFNLFLGSRRFITVGVAEKGFCWVRARVRSEPGHGSMPRADSAPLRLAEALVRLGRKGLPHHRTQVVEAFLRAVAGAQPRAIRPLLAGLSASGALPHLVGLIPDRSIARAMATMFANTAAPTVLKAGDQANVIPGVAEAHIDGRTLPGQTDTDLLGELAAVLGPDVELEVMASAPPVETSPFESDLLGTIRAVLAQRQPDATVVPYLVPGFTDAKAFTRLGARWYGFVPVRLPRGLRFADLYHGVDERIPIDGLAWGTSVLAEVVTRFCGQPGFAFGLRFSSRRYGANREGSKP
ncbi:MAG: M20/M25/M40 family metallo-hydrolase [Deltaproteobacteria bacterium]|jgi:acetylornithine deacetylase/succinyl-diaminopimelate desuccinylase-like protein|nr:M20/M25/M40 family metallo-hydrolase [Deltaproteobacteria bacterium]MBW2537329.1 M20/M25/M40 family metallo-hydrolase [Deltaproteobacteria bacterium]